MNTSRIPHGGRLVNQMADQDRVEVLRRLSKDLPSLTLSERQQCDLELLLNGALSPLQGFMNSLDYESVLNRMRLQDGTLWPVPICLDVSAKEAQCLEAGQSVALRDLEGFMMAVLHIEEIWPADKRYEAEQVYGCCDSRHEGVDQLLHRTGTHYIGGTVEGVMLPSHFDYKQLRYTPEEMRALFAKLGWRKVVGFQTRNPLYRAQFEMTLRAMGKAKASLLLHVVAGGTRPADIDTYTRVRSHIAAGKHYPPNMMLLNILPLAMRMAGPREAVLHAVIHKNFGCTHFVIGCDHAGPGQDSDGSGFYDPDAARKLAQSLESELGIQIIPFDEMVYVPDEESYLPRCEVPPDRDIRTMTGTELRNRLRLGRDIPEWFTFPEVVEELRKAYPPRHQQGFTVFCTGLSGAGKSTIARVLYERFMEMGGRPVTLLDGDIIRRHLSSELGFSKEHRDINVRRIGFVASEITKNRGIAICAPIGPYTATRNQVRQMVEAYGGFVEVHVATPLEVCELRDRKGLYAKARAGIIKGFTGVDDPYEPPENPEVYIDTTSMTPDEAAQEVLLFLERAGFIK